MLAISQIVGIHDRADVSFFHGRFKDRQINLVHGAFIDDGIGAVAIKLRVVAHEMLDGRRDSLSLHTFYVADCDARPQEWIFAKVLEIAAAKRRALEVDARSQDDLDALRLGLGAYRLGHLPQQAGVPGGRQGRFGGEAKRCGRAQRRRSVW